MEEKLLVYVMVKQVAVCWIGGLKEPFLLVGNMENHIWFALREIEGH